MAVFAALHMRLARAFGYVPGPSAKGITDGIRESLQAAWPVMERL